MSVRERTFDDIQVGEVASFETQITDKTMEAFRQITGDENPLHADDAFASKTEFGRRVVYGQLLNSFFSKLIGHYFPGKHALYLSQTSRFEAPGFIGDRIRVTGRVVEKHAQAKLLTIETSIHRIPGEDLLVSGTAVAMVQGNR